MKNIILVFSAVIMLHLLSSCDKEEPVIPDPDGTITQTLNYTVGGMAIILYQGLDETPTDPGIPYVQIKTGIRDASLNFSFDAITALDYNIIQYMYIGSNMGGEMVDVGMLDGLGYISEIPSAGWTKTAAVQIGHGYVLRYRYTFNYPDSNLPYHYAILYVEDWLTSTNGGIIGARVKYQQPYQ